MLLSNIEKEMKLSYEYLVERHRELYSQICATDRAALKAFAYQRKDLDDHGMDSINFYTTLLGERCDILSQYIKGAE